MIFPQHKLHCSTGPILPDNYTYIKKTKTTNNINVTLQTIRTDH